jgi:DNA-directed RNA polymerase subunit beta
LKSLLGGSSSESKSEKKIFSGYNEGTSQAKQNFLNVDKQSCLSARKASSLSTPEAWYNIAKLLNLKKMRRFSSSAKKNLKNQNLKTLKPKNKKKKEMLELGRKWFFKKFMNPRTYDLSKQGRFAINQKLSLNLSLFQTTLTEKDLLAATDYLMKVEKGIYKIDDIDHLKNRRVRSSGDLIQVQFGIGLIRLEKAIRLKLNQDRKDAKSFYLNKSSSILKEKLITSNTKAKTNKLKSYNNGGVNSVNRSEKKISRVFTDIPISGFIAKESFYFKSKFLNSMIQPKFINGALKEFFGTHPLSQFMDQINPLSELTHKRRLSSLGPGGVSRDTATLAVRGIHSSHYGRICPIETPEGKNTGLVNSLTTYARVNKNGLIETPFYKIYKGQIQKNVGRVYLSADKEESFKIATPDLKISKLNFLPKQKIPVRIGKDFIPTYRRYVSFIGISPVQMISIATALIPFLEHDDANRALMGSNMQRQAVPLVRSQRPFVGTGLEARAVADSGHAMLTAKSGYILYVSGSKIFLYCDNKKKFL